MQLLMQQHVLNKTNSKENNNNNNSSFIQKTISKTQLSIDDINKSKSNFLKNDNEETKSKISIPTIYRQTSNSTLNQSEIINKFQRPKTAIIQNQTYINPPPSRLSTEKVKSTPMPSASTKKKSYRIDSISNLSKQPFQSTIGSASSNYSQTIYAGRSISAAVHRSVPQTNDTSCSIREAKGKSNRYNKPEELFGIRPEELFAPEQQHQPKILDQRSTTKPNENTRLKRNQFQTQQHIWQQDVDKIIELYNVHHCSNYRKSAVPPTSNLTTQAFTQQDTLNDLSQSGRVRRMSTSKNTSTNLKSSTNPKQPTFTVLNMPRRNSVSRPPIKLTNT